MSAVVERVAQEVCNALTRGRRGDMLAIEEWGNLCPLQREVWLRLVRAVIGAMRVPTNDMCWATRDGDSDYENWQAMIDAALEGGE